MNVRVLLHVGLLMETLATMLTGERARIGMDEKVCGERGRAFERFATDLALKASFLRVSGVMLDESENVTERFRTEFAGKGPRFGDVRASNVHFEPVRGGKGLITVVAFVRLEVLVVLDRIRERRR